MMMKRNVLSVACAMAFATMAGEASAAACGIPTAANDFDFTGATRVTLSGATAPDNFLAGIATDMFEPGFCRYQDNGGSVGSTTDDGRLFRAFYGKLKSTADIPAALKGQNVLFVKRSKGGSVWGVNPIARAERISTIDLRATATGVPGCATLIGGIHRCAEIGIDPGVADYLTATNPALVSDFGVSDVEPQMFKFPFNTENDAPELTVAETARFTVKPVNVLSMGIVATHAVPATTYISRQGYGSMLAGSVTDWNQIDPSINSGNTQVAVCRRVEGSGTQTSYNWFFNNFPCQGGFAGAVAPARMADSAGFGISGTGTQADPIIIDPTAGFTVVENSTSGQVRDCLKAAQNKTNHTFQGEFSQYYTVQFSNSADPFRAIGVLSLDSFGTSYDPNPAVGPGQTGATNLVDNGWAFRYLDGAGRYNAVHNELIDGPGTGVAPSKANLTTGKYDFAVELTMQYRKVNVTNVHGDVVPALAGVKLAFADEFIKRSGDPARNTTMATAALVPTFTPVLDANGVPTNNVARGTRGGNTCSPWQQLF